VIGLGVWSQWLYCAVLVLVIHTIGVQRFPNHIVIDDDVNDGKDYVSMI
jgi:hypothetical protein